MTDALKDRFHRGMVEEIGRAFAAVHPDLDVARFVARAADFESLGLTERGRHVASVMREVLPAEVPAALDVIVRSLGPPLDREEDFGFEVFRYLPHAYFIATHGVAHPELSLAAIHALTQRFTGEFTIRPFLEAHPERTLKALHVWARDPSAHVRRLVSEGTRPRLPWAPRLSVFAKDPSPVIALLEALRDDPSEYVRRSVANHLNDLTKDQSPLVLDLAERWMVDAPEVRRRLLRHALRTLIKKGDRRALALFGAKPTRSVTVSARLSSKRVTIGESLDVELTVTNTSRAPLTVELDLRVHFLKVSGAASPKVFKVRHLTLDGGASATASRRVSFAVHTTRRPTPGVHRLEALVNGAAHAIGEVKVGAARPER